MVRLLEAPASGPQAEVTTSTDSCLIPRFTTGATVANTGQSPVAWHSDDTNGGRESTCDNTAVLRVGASAANPRTGVARALVVTVEAYVNRRHSGSKAEEKTRVQHGETN
ncbi:hypothetical protein HG531_005952 [Fusarium graminearum]|nr:hypothetical protein HG531_005952 [Fusarium graminearum]